MVRARFSYETPSIGTTLHLEISLYMKSTLIYTRYIVILFADPLSKFRIFESFYFWLADCFQKQAITKFLGIAR
jgi:uncharacterized membrane protein